MRMMRITLDDGTVKEASFEEMDNTSVEGMMEFTNGKKIINTEFFEESGQ